MNERKILLICSVGFVLQTYMLIIQFAKFNTVINMDYESSKYHSIPAITICLPNLLSMKKVFEYFQHDNSSSVLSDKVTKAYEMYQAALVNFSSIDNNMTRKDFMNSIYLDNFESLIPNLTIMQLYEMSIPISSESSFVVNGSKLNEDGSSSYFQHQAHPPIESLMLGFNNDKLLRKCFTYFSHLDQEYRDMNAEIYNMYLTFIHDENDFPLSFYHDNNLKICYAIHSGNTIPQDYDQYEFFDHNNYYTVMFNRLKIQLLKPPYKTNCQDYDHTGKTRFYNKIF